MERVWCGRFHTETLVTALLTRHQLFTLNKQGHLQSICDWLSVTGVVKSAESQGPECLTRVNSSSLNKMTTLCAVRDNMVALVSEVITSLLQFDTCELVKKL